MANQIRFTPTDLHNQAAELRRCADNIHSNYDHIQYILTVVSGGWIGDEIADSISAIRKDMTNLEKNSVKLYSLAEKIEQAARTIEAVESEVAAMFNMYNSSDDDIYSLYKELP